MELKSIGVMSCGKLMGAMYAMLGLIAGAIMALVSLAGAAAQPQMQNGADPMMMFGAGIGALIFLPVLYGVMGFIGGITGSLLYNIIAGYVGGIELNFQQHQEASTSTY